ncbi:hypothetical protein GmHk_18G052456 [Glycine max]|nr:hypothetical protein GmHk_18G052456 [Glycine max]
MASTSGDATPPSPKTVRLMVEMIKLGDQIRRMSYENEERMARMRKENEESLRRIHRSSENIERRRDDRSSNSFHGEDEGYEEDEGGMRNGSEKGYPHTFVSKLGL